MLSLAVALAGLIADPQCKPIEVTLTSEERVAEANFVGRVTDQTTGPDGIGRILAEDGWRVIWATPYEHERGVFFLRLQDDDWKMVNVWGGVILPEERAETIDWARKLPGKPSQRLAECFADALLAGE